MSYITEYYQKFRITNLRKESWNDYEYYKIVLNKAWKDIL